MVAATATGAREVEDACIRDLAVGVVTDGATAEDRLELKDIADTLATLEVVTACWRCKGDVRLVFANEPVADL